MKRTFKERAVFGAARIQKKAKLLTPVIFIALGILLGCYGACKYFANNSKKYISIGMIFMFFIMSSSFATPDQVGESEVYLAVDDGVNISDIDVPLESGELLENESYGFVSAQDEIVSIGLISKEEELELESTDNIDTFTVDDFISSYSLSGDSVVADGELSGFDKEAWYLILVNKTHPVPDGYNVPLTTISGSMECDERVVDTLRSMLNAAKKDGVNLVVCSPYRDYQLQEKLFLRKVNAYMAAGYSYLDAYKKVSTDVIVPGASEHQLGLAFDIVVDYHAVLDWDFGDTSGGKWLREHCAEFGFILRYPKGKEDITGIEYEPWHFRYVGVEAATYIMENELTLEEFLEDL